jgi:hypothetical protein
MIDYEVQRFTRHCATSGRELTAGEVFYSALVSRGAQVARLDYSAEEWQGPPEGALGWWKSQVPGRDAKKLHWAPNEVMLELLEQMEEQPDKLDMRYVLALLLVRRRVLRLEETDQDERDQDVLVLYCARRETTYKVAVVVPNEKRTAAIQEELAQLLFSK